MAERKYNGDTLHNQWQSLKVKKNPKEDYEAKPKYEYSREYQIMVEVVAVFGTNTNNVWVTKAK